MANSREEILNYLKNTMDLNTKYAHHKELMAWLGIAFYSAFIGFLPQVPVKFTTIKIITLCMLIIITAVIILYVKQQFKLRKRGSEYESACLVLTTEIISNPNNQLNPADFLLSTKNDPRWLQANVLSKIIIDKANWVAQRGQGARRNLETLAYIILLGVFSFTVIKIFANF